MIGKLLDWVSRRLADQITRNVAATRPPRRRSVPINSVFVDDLLAAERREVAASFLDDNLLGYVVVCIRDQDGEIVAQPEIALSDEMWPTVRYALAQLIIAGEIYQ